MPADQPLTCPHCGRRAADENGLYCHVKAKHGRRAARPFRPEPDREPSMGELVADAQLARAMGEPVEDWIAEGFDV